MEFNSNSSREEVFKQVEHYLLDKGFSIIDKDDKRPWGGFFVIDEKQAEKFINDFFPEYGVMEFENKVSPKFLIVEPGKRLSWQYHHRRAEVWRVMHGPVEIAVSDNDTEPEGIAYTVNEMIRLTKGQRHRLKGIDEWGVVAEIWQHTDADHPSDEEDIVRLKDDFGRGE
jgi:mannose-6-phosphate isomerase-like protein (cupin superfamily)